MPVLRMRWGRLHCCPHSVEEFGIREVDRRCWCVGGYQAIYPLDGARMFRKDQRMEFGRCFISQWDGASHSE